MKRLFLFYLLFTSSISIFASNTEYELNYSRIKLGEELNYTAHWGFLTIGSATTTVDDMFYKIGNKKCYKIDVQGRTNGIAKIFYVRDKWTAYLDSSNIITHKSSRSIREGSYAIDEIVDFDQVNKKASVKVFDKTTKRFKLKKIYDTTENVRDIIGGFIVVRMIELDKIRKGSIFSINGFLEDQSYEVNVIYDGLETIKVNNKQLKCHKMRPIVPKNSVFDGKNSVEVWFSNDEKQNIVRIKAKMFVGNIIVDLAVK